MATPVWISLGSNLGDRRAILDEAIVSLRESPGLSVRSVSSYHETKPIGGPPGQGPFLNAAAHLETTLDPFQLLEALQRIENQAGRVRVIRWGERTLDLDILIFGTKFLDTKELKLPHPRLALRRFVLEPLAEIAPKIVDTMTKRTISDLLANLDRKPRLIELDGSINLVTSPICSALIKQIPAFLIEPRKTLLGKIEALQSNRWETLGTWGVADFFVDTRTVRRHFERESEFLIEVGPIPEAIVNNHLEDHWKERVKKAAWEEQIRNATSRAVEPIFVVILDKNSPEMRQPGISSIPQLWPDFNDPDAIVAEVIATCRGIEAI